MNNKDLIPKIRFTNFDSEWNQNKLGETADITKLAGYEFTKHIEYNDIGKIPAIRGLNVKSGKFVFNDVKYIDNSDFSKLSRSKLFGGDVVFTYVGTIGEAAVVPSDVNWYLAPNVARIRPKEICSEFLYYLLINPQFKNKEVKKWIATSSQPALSMENIRKFDIYYPELIEQSKLSIFFNNLSNSITLQQQLLNDHKQLKKAMLQKMFPQKGETVPRVRFAKFTDNWEQRRLDEFFEKYQNTIYLEDKTEYEQVTVKNTGIIEGRGTKLGREIGRKRQYIIDTENYPNTLTFTRQTIYEGGIGFVPNNLNGAIVTENMPLLNMKKNMIKDFIIALLKSPSYHKDVIYKNMPIGSAQKALHEKDWLRSYLLIPNLKEQEKIGAFFKQLDENITLNENKLETYQELKKAMLQKMFV